MYLLFLRIDGTAQDISKFTSQKLSNETILVNAKKENASASGGLMMISLQYQSGRDLFWIFKLAEYITNIYRNTKYDVKYL